MRLDGFEEVDEAYKILYIPSYSQKPYPLPL